MNLSVAAGGGTGDTGGVTFSSSKLGKLGGAGCSCVTASHVQSISEAAEKPPSTPVGAAAEQLQLYCYVWSSSQQHTVFLNDAAG